MKNKKQIKINFTFLTSLQRNMHMWLIAVSALMVIWSPHASSMGDHTEIDMLRSSMKEDPMYTFFSTKVLPSIAINSQNQLAVYDFKTKTLNVVPLDLASNFHKEVISVNPIKLIMASEDASIIAGLTNHALQEVLLIDHTRDPAVWSITMPENVEAELIYPCAALKKLFVATRKELYVFALDNTDLQDIRVASFKAGITGLTYNPTNKMIILALANGAIQYINAETNEISDSDKISDTKVIDAVQCSPDGKLLAIRFVNHDLVFYDLHEKKLSDVTFKNIIAMTFGLNGSLFIASDKQKRLLLMNPYSGEILETLTTNTVVRAISISSDAKHLITVTSSIDNAHTFVTDYCPL